MAHSHSAPGGGPTADVSVRIAWADGTTMELHDVPADQVLRVAHG